VISGQLPVEAFFMGSDKFLAVAGLVSTGLINAGIFQAAPMVISIYNRLPYVVRKRFREYFIAMKQFGVIVL
jgi:hypothetical protein